jgi:hypothetical protein
LRERPSSTTIASRSSGLAIATSAERPNFEESIRPIPFVDEANAAWSVSESARRVVVKPCSRVIPPAEMKATSMFRPARNSAAQRPPIILRVWSTSPGVTTT